MQCFYFVYNVGSIAVVAVLIVLSWLTHFVSHIPNKSTIKSVNNDDKTKKMLVNITYVDSRVKYFSYFKQTKLKAVGTSFIIFWFTS